MKNLKNIIAKTVTIEEANERFGVDFVKGAMEKFEALKDFNREEYDEEAAHIYESGLLLHYFEGDSTFGEEISEETARNLFDNSDVDEVFEAMDVNDCYAAPGNMIALRTGLMVMTIKA